MDNQATATATATATAAAWDELLFPAALRLLYILCLLTFLPTHFINAPYGRHFRRGWGPSIPTPLAWFLMESPTLWLTLAVAAAGHRKYHPLAIITLSLFLLHYLNRTILYPLGLHRRRDTKKPSTNSFPLVIAAIAFVFNLLNSYLQARSATHYANYPSAIDFPTLIRLIVGVVVFFWGMKVNMDSDEALARLKAEGGGYKIPHGGWFEYVCSPNYMGEMVEWLGWATVAGSPAAVGFFLYTCANLMPRARSHLRWYKEKFGADFPAKRTAVIPLIY